MTRAPTLAWALAWTLAGCDDSRGPLDLGELVTPERECVELIHESLDLGGPIVAFASDTAGSRGGWALVSTMIDLAPVLAMVRVPASADEPTTAPIVVAHDPNDAPRFRLRAGLELGTAWLLRDTDINQVSPVILRKLAPGVGVVAANAELDNFPADESGAECPERWSRQLVLIEGRPFMLAIPDCSEGPSVELQLLELDEHDLGFSTNWTLAFDPCLGVDPQTCAAAYAYRLAAIGAGQSTHLPGASRVAIGFTQVRAFDDQFTNDAPILLSSDVSLLDLRVSETGPDARLLTFREVWVHVTPVSLGAVQLAQDHDALQIFVPNLASRIESALVRLDLITDLYLPAIGSEDALPFAGDGTLIQLERESAILQLDAELGLLRATALADIDAWATFPAQTLYEQPDLLGFESAGPGMLLIQRSEHPEQILHVTCLPDG